MKGSVKKVVISLFAVLFLHFFASCGKYNQSTFMKNLKEQHNLHSQTESMNQNSISENNTENMYTSSLKNSNSPSVNQISKMKIDYDLTKMSRDMIYGMVFQFLVESETYVGKTVKISGKYYKGRNPYTDETLYYVVVQDALACCAQGIEFTVDNFLISEDDLPADETEISVTGVFETYIDKAGYEGFRLKDSIIVY